MGISEEFLGHWSSNVLLGYPIFAIFLAFAAPIFAVKAPSLIQRHPALPAVLALHMRRLNRFRRDHLIIPAR
jgi:hypothetical protein